jgi:hypothetical protein
MDVRVDACMIQSGAWVCFSFLQKMGGVESSKRCV